MRKFPGTQKLSKLERDVIVHELYVSTIVVHEVKKSENLRNSVTDSFNEECSLPEDHKPGCDQVGMITFDIVANQSVMFVIIFQSSHLLVRSSCAESCMGENDVDTQVKLARAYVIPIRWNPVG